jgi:hypothetical protein
MYAVCASATALRFDNNRYSVNASAIGRPVEIHAYANRIVIRQNGRVVANPRFYLNGLCFFDEDQSTL